MKVAIVTARILLGSIVVVFGLNGFLHFLPQPPVPEAAGAFFGALAATGYMLPLVFGAQVVGGGLVLAGMVTLGVAILAGGHQIQQEPRVGRLRPAARCFGPAGP